MDDLLRGFSIFRGSEKDKRTVCIKHQRKECLCEVLGSRQLRETAESVLLGVGCGQRVEQVVGVRLCKCQCEKWPHTCSKRALGM